MKANVYFGIMWRIVLLFVFPVAYSFVDTNKLFNEIPNDYGEMEWSYTHCWVNALLIILFLLSLANLVVSIVKLIKQHYDTTKW